MITEKTREEIRKKWKESGYNFDLACLAFELEMTSPNNGFNSDSLRLPKQRT